MKHGSVSWHQLDDWDLKLSKFHILSRPMSHLLPLERTSFKAFKSLYWGAALTFDRP